jgi:hypothetical protein
MRALKLRAICEECASRFWMKLVCGVCAGRGIACPV